jgi:hypothetical protein
MAQILGSDTAVHEEQLGGGRWRIRQGADCVIVTPSRSGQIDPFSRAPPATLGACP